MQHIGSTYQFDLSARQIRSGRLDPQEQAALTRARALQTEIDEFRSTVPAGTQLDAGNRHSEVSADGRSVTVETREKFGDTRLSSHYDSPEATGLRGRLGQLAGQIAERALWNAEFSGSGISLFIGEQLSQVRDRFGRGAGPAEQQISKSTGNQFESVTFHNDGSIRYGSSEMDPNSWILKS